MERNVSIKWTEGSQELVVRELSEWDLVVDALVAHLKPGSIVLLSGVLGAGKTTLVQRLAERMGAKPSVQSPTFALMRWIDLKQTFQGLRRLIHIDAYRLEKPEDAMVLDLKEELFDGSSMAIVEWPERIEDYWKSFEKISEIIRVEINLRNI